MFVSFFIVSVAGEVFTGEPGPRDRTTRDRKDDQERRGETSHQRNISIKSVSYV